MGAVLTCATQRVVLAERQAVEVEVEAAAAEESGANLNVCAVCTQSRLVVPSSPALPPTYLSDLCAAFALGRRGVAGTRATALARSYSATAPLSNPKCTRTVTARRVKQQYARVLFAAPLAPPCSIPRPTGHRFPGGTSLGATLTLNARRSSRLGSRLRLCYDDNYRVVG